MDLLPFVAGLAIIVRKKLFASGKLFSEETRRKMSETAKKLYADGKSHIFPFKDTSIEKLIQGKLEELNIPFEKHKSILGRPDVFINPNICIFADGCYWHKCEKCGYGNGKKRDKMVTENLQKQGYVVLRFWEHDIECNLDSCIIKIIDLANGGAKCPN